jgi:hypothetical protein
MVGELTIRYPGQDVQDSMESFLSDLERLAHRYSVAAVQVAIQELRIRPGQRFFPRPDEVAEEMARQRDVEANNPNKFISCDRKQRNVEVDGRIFDQAFCSGGQLYQHRIDGAGNSAVRGVGPCNCWKKWRAERGEL